MQLYLHINVVGFFVILALMKFQFRFMLTLLAALVAFVHVYGLFDIIDSVQAFTSCVSDSFRAEMYTKQI